MKIKFFTLFACVLLFSSCHQNKEGIVKDLLDAENHYNLEKVSKLLTDSFIYHGVDTLTKEAYLSRLENLKEFECQASILGIQDLDSVVKTTEQSQTVIDLRLDIAPLVVLKKTYRFADDDKLISITVDSILNYEEYLKSFYEKWAPLAFWAKDEYGIEDEMEMLPDIKKYLSEYTNLPAFNKKLYQNYAHLQGTYISKDCVFYKKLIFKGKRTVTIVDAIFEFPYATSYELDENLVKIRTDQSDLLFEIQDSQTLIGEGFAKGIFVKEK